MRSRLLAIAKETVAIVERGSYQAGAATATIGAEVAKAVAGTRLILPNEELAPPGAINDRPSVQVTNESTLAASGRLGGDVACLVFASARNPGGGFLNGAQAQEEAIARSSALYRCLSTVEEFYAVHRADSNLAYSDRVIYSPAVPVFRDDDGELLPTPFPASMLTAAAPNLAAIRRNQPKRVAEVPAILARRAARILAVAATFGHRRLVLGAWGCGVFGNDPATVANVFGAALRANPRFDEVVFAVLDQRSGTPTYHAFATALG